MIRPVVVLKYDVSEETAELFGTYLAEGFKYDLRVLLLGEINQENTIRLDNVASELERIDASLLVVELSNKVSIQTYLNAFRNLRVPYLFVRSGHQPNFEKIALPVSFLIEEKEKGPFAAAFGRFFQSQLVVFQPKDYGSKALQNRESITALFDSFKLTYEVHQASKDSYGVEREAALWAANGHAGLVIISASREYGLDDWLFGSKERKILMRATIPVLVINPRADLYTLCD